MWKSPFASWRESAGEFFYRLFKQTEAIVLGLGALCVTSGLMWMMGVNDFSPRVVFVLSVSSIFLATFSLFDEVRNERDERQTRLDEIGAARPLLKCCGQKFVQIYTNSVYRFHVLQVWVCNQPDRRFGSVAARNVSVRLHFYRDGVKVIDYVSQWVEAIDPDVASFSGFYPHVDIPASDVPAKFLLILNHHANSESDCYAHSFGKLIGTPDGRYQPFRLSPGQYRIDMFFRGDNVDQEMSVQFVNHGSGTEPELLDIPKRTDQIMAS